jgi:hypothetical protein
MGSNYHTPISTATAWKPADVNPVWAELDRAVTYLKNVIIHSDGAITYTGGTLDWAGTLRIIFNRSDGQAIENTVATGSIALADNEFAYVDLNETDGTVLTMQKAAVTTAAASNFIAFNRLVMGYRNTTSNLYYGVNLHLVNAAAGAGAVNKYISFTIADDGDWDNEAIPIYKAPADTALTLNLVDVAVLGSSTPTLAHNIEERAEGSLNSAGTDVYSIEEIAPAGGLSIASFANSNIASGAHLVLTTSDISSGGVVDYITGVITYQED